MHGRLTATPHLGRPDWRSWPAWAQISAPGGVRTSNTNKSRPRCQHQPLASVTSLCAGDIKNTRLPPWPLAAYQELEMSRTLPISRPRGAVSIRARPPLMTTRARWRFTSGSFGPVRADEAQPAGGLGLPSATPHLKSPFPPNLATPLSPVAPVRCAASYCRFRPWGLEPRGPLPPRGNAVTALF